MDYREMTSPNFSRGHPERSEGPRTDAVEILLKEDDQSFYCEILRFAQDDRLLRM
jgi:hypothetical protein